MRTSDKILTVTPHGSQISLSIQPTGMQERSVNWERSIQYALEALRLGQPRARFTLYVYNRSDIKISG